MRYFVLHIILLISSFESFSQTLVWEKLIDFLPNGESIYSVDQDSDTTFVYTCSSGANTVIVKAKLNGDTLWKKNTNIFPCINHERIAAYRLSKLMHFGNKNVNSCFETNFFIQKLSSDGTVISSWEYGDSGVRNMLENFAILSNGGFLASGFRQSTYYNYLALMKLDSSGNMLWYKKYRDISWKTDVIINRKGNYLLSASSGDQIFSPVTYHPYFMETSPDGDSITSKYLIVHADSVNEHRNPWTWSMLQNEDGDYVFTVSIDSVNVKGVPIQDKYAAVVMMDTLFNIKWKLYLHKGEGGRFWPTRAIELKDGSYVLVVMNILPYSSTFYYYKISKTGQVLDQKTFSSSICSQVHATEIKLLSDSSMIVSGACNGSQNAYLARIGGVGLPMIIDTCASFTASFSALQESDSLYLTNTSNGGYAYAWQSEWKFADSTEALSFNHKIKIPPDTDSIWVRLKAVNLNGCEDIIEKKIKIDVITAVKKSSVLSVKVFPNPAKESVTIHIPGTAEAVFSIYTSQGYLVKEELISGGQGEINLNVMSGGLYLYKVQDGERVGAGKFIKE